jgi:DNA polymerase-3 subunit epsilon
MTAGQGALALGLESATVQTTGVRIAEWDASIRPRVLRASEADNAAHAARLAAIGKASGQDSLWQRVEAANESRLDADAVSS